MKKIVIFCGAPADVQYALSIYEKYRNEGKFHFFAIHVKGIYKFLTELRLKNAHVEFIPYPNLNIKNPTSIIQVRKYIKTHIKRYFKDLRNCDVYYFSNKYDWLVYAFIANLAKKNKVFYYDHYAKSKPYKKKRLLSAKHMLIVLIYLYLTRVILHFEWLDDRAIISFSYVRYGIVEREIFPSAETNAKYAYHVDVNGMENSILFFESSDDGDMIENYEATLKTVVNVFLNNGFKPYIKPHPRVGYSRFLDDYGVEILPSYIPGEFIDYDRFSAIVGIATVATAKIAIYADVPIFSLIDLFMFKNISEKETYRQYLSDQSNQKIKFVYDVEEVLASCKKGPTERDYDLK